jgi:hypothetical protein
VHINFDSEFEFLKPHLPSDAIRLGSAGDGGYVVSRQSVMRSDILLSFGLGDNFSFEKGFNRLVPKTPIWIYDHTVPTLGAKFLLKSFASAVFAIQPSHFLAKFRFFREYKKYFIKNQNNKHERSRVTHRAYKPIDKSALEILNECNEKTSIFLKIDIEGDEYKILDDLFSARNRICGAVIEFHNAGTHYQEFKRLVQIFSEFMFIDHFHVNNYDGVSTKGFPEVVELSFSNKNLKIDRKFEKTLPIADLDYANTKKYSDYSIEWSTNF